MHHVPCSPSKIPYVGFTPVRLQTGIHPRPSLSREGPTREARMHHSHDSLYADTAAVSDPCGPYRACLAGSSYHGHPVQRPLAPRRVLLSRWIIAYYGLIRDSRSSCRLICFVQQDFALRPRMGWQRELPQFNPHVFSTMPPPVPRRPDRLHLTVTSPVALAFAFFAEARLALSPTHVGSNVGRVTRLQSSLNAAAWRIACPSPKRTFTSELSPPESPQKGVGYNYAGKQSIPAVGLPPTDTRPYGLRTKDTKRTRESRR